MTRFEVYTYFGRVISRHYVKDNELHHRALESGRLSVVEYERTTGQFAWVRLVS